MNFDLQIQHEDLRYGPAVTDGVTWELERKGTPGRLSFTAVDDGKLALAEGDTVTVHLDGQPLFLGFIFNLKTTGDGLIKVTAYDQLRYLKNKETYNYEGLTVGELIKMIAADFSLLTGELADTGYKVSRVEDGQTLFDIIQNALDVTLQATGNMYVLYDDFGKLTLRSIADMQVPLLIDRETAQSYDCSSGIDSETYNVIKLERDNEETGKRDVYIANDEGTVKQWGVLQYFEKLGKNDNGKVKADSLLSLYNHVARSLSVRGAFGDIRVRAGSLIGVQLDLGLTKVNHFMLVEKVKHQFENGLHTMDLNLRGGGDFV